MARPKAKVRTVPASAVKADGLATVKVEYKDGDDSFTIDVLAPEPTGAGIVAWQQFVNATRAPGKDGADSPDPDGNADLAARIVATHVQTVKAAHQLARKAGEEIDTRTVFPSAPSTRTLDPMDVYSTLQAEHIRTHRRPPNEQETAAIYAQAFGAPEPSPEETPAAKGKGK